jgi:hypothetical protein
VNLSTIETKVIAAASGAGGGSIIGAFVLWLCGVTFWHAPNSAAGAEKAIAAVPAPVSALVLAVAAAGVSALAGYWAPHTARTTTESPAAGTSASEPAASTSSVPPLLPFVTEAAPTGFMGGSSTTSAASVDGAVTFTSGSTA